MACQQQQGPVNLTWRGIANSARVREQSPPCVDTILTTPGES